MFDDEKGNFVSLKQGEEAIVKIENVRKVNTPIDIGDGKKINGLMAKGEDKGYCYEVDTDQGVITVNSWALLKALSPFQEGDTILIKHLVGQGKWEITKVENALE